MTPAHETIQVDVGALVEAPDVGRGRRAKPRRPKRWSWHVGPYRCRVRVFATASGMIYAELRSAQGAKRESLKHRDRERAKAWAKDEQAKLALGLRRLDAPAPTVGRVVGFYLERQLGKYRDEPAEQHTQQRCADFWRTVLGDTCDLEEELDHDKLDRVVQDRLSGAIDAHGQPVPPGVDEHGQPKRRPVRARTPKADLEWLRAACLWAQKKKKASRRPLLRVNPLAGYDLPEEQNPRWPVATADRYEAIRRVSDQVMMEVRGGGKRLQVRSYLSEILDLVNATGRRVSAVLQLRYEDLRLSEGPHGGIRWPADTDKMGRDWWAPITATARAALDRVLTERPGIGRAYLFPSPRHREHPVSKDLASAWLERGEELAELPKQEGSLWHAYRRKWATERKHLPDVDVAAAGGWKETTSLKAAYQQVDSATLLRVVTDARELREAHNVR